MKTLRQDLNLTQEAVALACGMSRLAVLRYEQYLYEQPSPKLIRFYQDQFPGLDYSKRYSDARFAVQAEANLRLEPLPNLRMFRDEHPFITWRTTITTRAVGEDSRMAFCKFLALHPATVAEYEHGRLRNLPSAIREALFNVPSWYLDNLDNLGAIWYDRKHNG